MRVATGKVVAGKVVLDEQPFADGTGVYVMSRDSTDEPALSPEELAELDAGLAEADRGEMIAGEEFFKQLRRHG
jgi:predicted transcriptional regulator